MSKLSSGICKYSLIIFTAFKIPFVVEVRCLFLNMSDANVSGLMSLIRLYISETVFCLSADGICPLVGCASSKSKWSQKRLRAFNTASYFVLIEKRQ